jgi:hypothetical protein
MVVVGKSENEKLYALAARQAEIFKRVRNGGLSIDNALAGTQGVLEGHYPLNLQRYQYIPDWYVEPEQQIKKVQAFLDLNDVALLIPPAPYFRQRTPFEVLMLAAYLPGKMCVDGVQRTKDAWSNFIVPPKGHTKHVWDELKSDPQHLRLANGIKHVPGIRWIVLDPNTNEGTSPKSCWNDPKIAPRLAGAEILMAAAIFDEWHPNCNLAGYQFYDEEEWDMTPCLTTVDVPGQLTENAYPANMAEKGRSNPEVRELIAIAA